MDITVLKKGEKINIAEKVPALKNLLVGMGWDVNTSGGADFDLDVTAVLCNSSNKAIDSKHLVYYDNLEFKKSDGTVVVKHSADDLTGGSSEKGDDEFINFHLNQMPDEVQSIYIFGNIYEAKDRKQDYSMVNSSYLRLVDGDTEVEFARHDLQKEYAGKTAVMLAKLYRMGADWKVEVLAEGTDGSIQDVLKAYSLE